MVTWPGAARPRTAATVAYSGPVRFALINSGLGLLAASCELHRLRPAADLILAMDPDGMPWGPRAPEDIAARALAMARAAAEHEPDVLVLACNSGSVHALELLRSEFEPAIPVVGTVPAIKPAAAAARSVAIWATEATTASAYQRKLITEFAGPATVTAVACPGLADAIDAGDEPATAQAVADAAARTPDGCGAVVLGCTEYELAASQIVSAVPGARLFGSAGAVAAQALRRAAAAANQAARDVGPANSRDQGGWADHAGSPPDSAAPGNGRAGTLRVLLSGRSASLPVAALRYREGRLLATLAAAREPAGGLC
jgi:glutamate racemase